MTDIDVKVLDILFRSVSPNHILDRLGQPGSVVDITADRKLFQSFCKSNLSEYSHDEQNLIFSRLQSEAAKLASSIQQKNRKEKLRDTHPISTAALPLPSLAIYSVLSFANRVLCQNQTEPECKIDQVFSWREAFLLLGQDIFVCAYLAAEDLQRKVERQQFTWPAVIRTNHIALNMMLQRGLAENHQHLYGSSQTFALSWCNLMNYPESHLDIGDAFQELYHPFVISSADDGLFSTKERVRYASLCRSHLFQWLKVKNNACVNCCMSSKAHCNSQRENCWFFTETKQCPYIAKHSECNISNLWWWIHNLSPEIKVANILRALRIQYGAKVPQIDGSTACLDYALENKTFQADPDAPFRALAGERSLLYKCYKAFFSGEMDQRTQLVFYLYLVLKSLFRSELIQVNSQVGFRNFSDYQDRKAILCNQPFYWTELIRMAINAPIATGNVTSFETRLSPRSTPMGYIKYVSETDESKRFSDLECKDFPINRLFLKEIASENYDATDYFYVFHFIKRPDVDPSHFAILNLVCRHHSLRQDVREQAIALADALSSSAYLAKRIKGIDCASHEIGCPPEVFATTYRFLRNFSPSDFCNSQLFSKPTSVQLSATYHAGEDFLDIASALRTIDEAVTFLELHRGDRIGHALGLGVDPSVHYALKGKRVFIRKQDRLDDLVWLLYRGRELGVHIDSHLYGSLKREAEILLLEIYGEAIHENNWHITLTEYHCCMQLRADDPSLYINIEFTPPKRGCHPYDEFMYSITNLGLNRYRQTPSLAGMYYYYHFGKREKIIGRQITEVVIDAEYMELMREAQHVMQKYLAQDGIIIECNPSSNVLIGTFGHYTHHPIFRFNNTDLEHDLEKYRHCPQLQVCVNTDDLGVFDTSQEFEYALLFQALVEMRAPDGSPLHKEADILRYLNNIREMGHNAAFNHPSYTSSHKEQQNKQGGNKWVT